MKVDVETIRRVSARFYRLLPGNLKKTASHGKAAVSHLVYMQVTIGVFNIDFRLRSPR
jgi:hypothetical protein